MSVRDFAQPIVNVFKALCSEERRGILIELEFGPLSYTEIIERLKLEKGTFNYHLKGLIMAGLIRNYLIKDKKKEFTSFYEVSELGLNVINGLLNAFRPSLSPKQFSP